MNKYNWRDSFLKSGMKNIWLDVNQRETKGELESHERKVNL